MHREMYPQLQLIHEEKEEKSERRMPRLPEAMKDVVSCEKVRDLQTGIDPDISEWGNPSG